MASYKKFVVDLAKKYNQTNPHTGDNLIYWEASEFLKTAKKSKISQLEAEQKETAGV